MRKSITTALTALLLTGAAAVGPKGEEAGQRPAERPAQGAEASALQPFATYPLGTVLGSHGYFEVTPAGTIIFYPTWSSVHPSVMQTIFAMMGATSLVGQRGHYQVGSDEMVRFYLPPGTTPGYFDPRFVPPVRPYAKPAPTQDQGQPPPHR